MSFKFEKLEVWQDSIEIGYQVHLVTIKFPKDELYVLTPQIKHAVDSISLNIAEGSTGQTNAEFSKFLGYAIRSAIEVVSCLFIARKRKIINEEEFQNLYKDLEVLVKKIQALRRSLDTRK
jgi:four helix bundle protein